MTPEQMLQELRKILRPGDVINFDSKPRWYQFWLRIVFAEIRRCQKKMGFKLWRDIHSVLVVGFYQNDIPRVLSATVPVAVIEPLRIGNGTRNITVCRLRGAEDGFSDEWLKTMREAAHDLAGRDYDPLDLLAIKLKLQDWPKWITKYLDMGKKRVVCSGAVLYCLRRAWAKTGETDPINPPLGMASKVPVNRATPAHFVNHDESFTIIYERRL